MIPSCSLLTFVPTGGGGGGSQPQITNQLVEVTGTGFGTVTISYTLDNDGKVYSQANTDPRVFIEQWLQTGGTASNYEAQATLVTGDTPTGTLGSYLTLGNDEFWSLSATAGHTKQCDISVSIRDVATQTVRTTATITMIAANST
jgi:hypothetical protein